MIRKLYRSFLNSPRLDRLIYRALDALTDAYAQTRDFSFPKNYIRQWKWDMLFERYEKDTARLFKRATRPGMTIIDIGAHIGYFTRIAARRVGRTGAVYAFEADRENFSLLAKNTKRCGNVRCIPIAITGSEGRVDFYHMDDKSGAHSILPNAPLDFSRRKITVPAATLDGWLTAHGVPHVDVIKMDIEGGESAALAGMQRTLREARILFTEFAPAWIEAAGKTPQEFLRNIAAFGFTIFAITGRGLQRCDTPHKRSAHGVLPKSREGRRGAFVNLYCVKR